MGYNRTLNPDNHPAPANNITKLLGYDETLDEPGYVTGLAVTTGGALTTLNTLAVTTSLAVTTTTALTGVLTPTGGIAPAGGTAIVLMRPGCVHSGGIPATATAEGVNSTPVNTEIYYSELSIPGSMSVTGISVFNGSVSSDSWHRALVDANGALITGTATGAVAASGTDVYQKVPFTGGAVTITGPRTLYMLEICSGNTDRYNTHGTVTAGLGFPLNMVAGKITSATYGAIPATNTLTLTYTTDLARICSLYL